MTNWRRGLSIATQLRWLLFMVPLVWGALQLPRAWFGHSADFHAYRRGAENVIAGESMYHPLPPEGPHFVPKNPDEYWYLYPPPLAALMALTDAPVTEHAVVAVGSVLAPFVIGAAGAHLAGVRPLWPMLLVGTVMLLRPYSRMMPANNVHYIMSAITAVAIAAPAALSAFLLALAGAVKVTPVWPLAVVLTRAGRRARAGFAAAAAAVLGTCLAALGPDRLIDETILWITRVAPTVGQGMFGRTNLSPTFAPLRLVLEEGPLPAWARLYLIAAQLLIPLAVAWITRRLDWRTQAGYVLVAAIASGPIMRGWYTAPALILPALVYRHWRQRTRAADGPRAPTAPMPSRHASPASTPRPG